MFKNPLLTIILLMFAMYASCGPGDNAPKAQGESPGDKNPLVTVTMENGKKFFIELYPKTAPNSVNNFISLAKSGFYDGVIFHRVIPGFMIQGGDPLGTGAGGPGYLIKGEFSNNNFENNLKHTRGVLSMARRGSQSNPASMYDTAGSQFFVMVADSPHLDNDYAAFGKVVEGMETVDQIVGEKRDGSDRPHNEQKIKSMAVETYGIDYPEPETIPGD